MRRFARARTPRPRVVEQRGIIGMRDGRLPAALTGQAASRRARKLLNVYPNDLHLPTELLGRPGYSSMGGDQPVAAGRVQWIGQYTRAQDQVEHTLAVIAGALYQYDWDTESWSAVDMDGNALDAAAPAVAAVTFTNLLILSDGTQSPLAWDGSGWTVLSACPPLYGQPVVYFAKLTGIMASDRTTIVWSEEADPTIGYDSGGYNNAWAVTQTQEEALVALAAREQGMLVARSGSVTAIFGATTPEFSSSGTREAVYDRIGVGTPFGVAVVGNSVYWLDSDGRLQRHTVGTGLHDDPPAWRDAAVACDTITRGALDRVRIAMWPELDAILVAVPDNGAPECNRILVFHVETGTFLSIWDGWEFEPHTLGNVKNAAGEIAVAWGTADGRIYLLGHPDRGPWTDAGAAITHEVHGAPIGYDQISEKLFDRLDLTLAPSGDLSELTIGWISPEGERLGALTIPSHEGGERARWDHVKWDAFKWAGATAALESHVAVGLDLPARWMVPVIRHTTGGERFALSGWLVTFLPLAVPPEVR